MGSLWELVRVGVGELGGEIAERCLRSKHGKASSTTQTLHLTRCTHSTTWAETYEEDMNKLQFHSAGLLADMLTDALSRGGKNDVSKLRVLDVACGTGTVGDALAYEDIAPLLVLTS